VNTVLSDVVGTPHALFVTTGVSMKIESTMFASATMAMNSCSLLAISGLAGENWTGVVFIFL